MILPDQIDGDGDGVVVRCWRDADTHALGAAIAASLEHLRPWMAWIADEPVSAARRRAMISGWERARLRGGDAIYGVLVDGRVAGGCGLHRRVSRRGLEIGYWLHPDFTGRGLATGVAARLAVQALSLPRVDWVEIHHDRANQSSAGVPRRLGFTFLGEFGDTPEAPGEIGREWRWRATQAWEPPRLRGFLTAS